MEGWVEYFKQAIGYEKSGSYPLQPKENSDTIVGAFMVALATKDKEREEEAQKKAYLWFNTYYEMCISPKQGNFGHWSAERLQTLGYKITIPNPYLTPDQLNNERE